VERGSSGSSGSSSGSSGSSGSSSRAVEVVGAVVAVTLSLAASRAAHKRRMNGAGRREQGTDRAGRILSP